VVLRGLLQEEGLQLREFSGCSAAARSVDRLKSTAGCRAARPSARAAPSRPAPRARGGIVRCEPAVVVDGAVAGDLEVLQIPMVRRELASTFTLPEVADPHSVLPSHRQPRHLPDGWFARTIHRGAVGAGREGAARAGRLAALQPAVRFSCPPTSRRSTREAHGAAGPLLEEAAKHHACPSTTATTCAPRQGGRASGAHGRPNDPYPRRGMAGMMEGVFINVKNTSKDHHRRGRGAGGRANGTILAQGGASAAGRST